MQIVAGRPSLKTRTAFVETSPTGITVGSNLKVYGPALRRSTSRVKEALRRRRSVKRGKIEPEDVAAVAVRPTVEVQVIGLIGVVQSGRSMAKCPSANSMG